MVMWLGVLGGVLGDRSGECLSGTWLGSYSTPFIFLTDTFTGKFLYFCYLGLGYFLFSVVYTKNFSIFRTDSFKQKISLLVNRLIILTPKI